MMLKNLKRDCKNKALILKFKALLKNEAGLLKYESVAAKIKLWCQNLKYC